MAEQNKKKIIEPVDCDELRQAYQEACRIRDINPSDNKVWGRIAEKYMAILRDTQGREFGKKQIINFFDRCKRADLKASSSVTSSNSGSGGSSGRVGVYSPESHKTASTTPPSSVYIQQAVKYESVARPAPAPVQAKRRRLTSTDDEDDAQDSDYRAGPRHNLQHSSSFQRPASAVFTPPVAPSEWAARNTRRAESQTGESSFIFPQSYPSTSITRPSHEAVFSTSSLRDELSPASRSDASFGSQPRTPASSARSPTVRVTHPAVIASCLASSQAALAKRSTDFSSLATRFLQNQPSYDTALEAFGQPTGKFPRIMYVPRAGLEPSTEAEHGEQDEEEDSCTKCAPFLAEKVCHPHPDPACGTPVQMAPSQPSDLSVRLGKRKAEIRLLLDLGAVKDFSAKVKEVEAGASRPERKSGYNASLDPDAEDGTYDELEGRRGRPVRTKKPRVLEDKYEPDEPPASDDVMDAETQASRTAAYNRAKMDYPELYEAYDVNPHPEPDFMRSLASSLGLSYKQVSNFFTRMRKKNNYKIKDRHGQYGKQASGSDAFSTSLLPSFEYNASQASARKTHNQDMDVDNQPSTADAQSPLSNVESDDEEDQTYLPESASPVRKDVVGLSEQLASSSLFRDEGLSNTSGTTDAPSYRAPDSASDSGSETSEETPCDLLNTPAALKHSYVMVHSASQDANDNDRNNGQAVKAFEMFSAPKFGHGGAEQMDHIPV